MIVIVDYGRSNLFSLGQAFRRAGLPFAIADRPELLDGASRIVLPGTGAFGDAMSALRRRGLAVPLRRAAYRGVPMLGICLGMQLFAGRSEEFGGYDGLGLIPGVVRRLPEGAVRIPHVGWRRLDPVPGAKTRSSAVGKSVYFTHSFALAPEDMEGVEATVDVNGFIVGAAIRYENLLGYQFHPEKSATDGLALLAEFGAGGR